jgi:hypothetical protein
VVVGSVWGATGSFLGTSSAQMRHVIVVGTLKPTCRAVARPSAPALISYPSNSRALTIGLRLPHGEERVEAAPARIWRLKGPPGERAIRTIVSVSSRVI